MKMSLKHYNELHKSIADLFQSAPQAVIIMDARGYSRERIRWECYHHSKIDKDDYSIYTDDTIDTALIHIMRTFGSD
jgi:hypothetical protein